MSRLQLVGNEIVETLNPNGVFMIYTFKPHYHMSAREVAKTVYDLIAKHPFLISDLRNA
jgi:hypothetical protein